MLHLRRSRVGNEAVDNQLEEKAVDFVSADSREKQRKVQSNVALTDGRNGDQLNEESGRIRPASDRCHDVMSKGEGSDCGTSRHDDERERRTRRGMPAGDRKLF